MSEKAPRQSHEQETNAEAEKAAVELSRRNVERIKELAEAEKSPNDNDIEKLRETIESAAQDKDQLKVETQEAKQLPNFDQGTLKRNSFNKTMNKVQSQLPPAERAFSKLIHQKNIEAVSNLGSKTVARSSGILGGGLFAFTGSLVVLYFAKHYGFEYNYTIFIALYVVGFGGGLLFELLARFLQRSK